ncbi:MAG: hypothetical protein DKINENOH_04700 [bacterium]|nr:hypothetical protein [bacterium]
MKIVKLTICAAAIAVFVSSPAFAQQAGDYRSAASGNWSAAATWETFDGTNWVAAAAAPAGTETITVRGDDTVRVEVAVSVAGHVKVEETGIVEISTGSLSFDNGSTYEHARDGGSIPLATWGQGSTVLLTGTIQDAPGNRNQSFYNFTFNTPNLGRNRDMGWNDIVIGGVVRVINTGAFRWQLTSIAANDTAAFAIMGDVIVEDGQFAVQGTSNAQTTFIVHHYGNLNVTGGNFSLARGSQGNGSGTTTWYLHQGNFAMDSAATQNSNPTPGNAKFVFAKNDTQQVTFKNVTFAGGRIHFEVADTSTMEIVGPFVVNGNLVNRGAVVPQDTLTFTNGAVYEHARNGGSVPSAVWQEGSSALFTGVTTTAPENRGQDYYHLTLNTPGLTSNRDLALDGNTISGNLTVISTGSARWQLVGGSSGTVTIKGDVIVQAGQLATHGTSSATNVVVEHYGNINVTAGNFSIGRGSQGSGAGTTIWNLHEGNFSMSNATTQNSNPTPGNAKFVFTKDGGVQNLMLANVTYAGGGLPMQVDTGTTLNLDTTVVGGNGAFILSPEATLQTAHPGGLNAAIATTGVVAFSKAANFTFNGTQAQVAGALLPDTLGVLTLANPAGVAFNDTVRSAKLVVSPGTLMQIDSLGNVTADSGSVAGTVISKGELVAVAPLVFTNGSVYEHARDGGSVPSGVWNEGSTALFTGVTTTAPENRGQDYYHLTLNTPGLTSNRDLALDGNTIHGNLTVVSTGSARWQLVGGSSGTVTIKGDVIVQAGQLATHGTSSATNVVVEHFGDVTVTGGNFSIGRGSQGSGAGTTFWNLHEGNFSMSNATTQNSNPTPGNAKFVFTKDGGVQNLVLSNVTFGGGGLPIQVDSSATLNMDTTAVRGNGAFILSAGATLQTARAGGLDGAIGTTGVIALSKAASFTFNGIQLQAPGVLLPDTIGVLTLSNPAGVAFNDTVKCAELLVNSGTIMLVDSLGSATADSGSVSGTVVNKGVLAAIAPLNFENGSVYEHARDGGSVPSGAWNKGSTAMFTGVTTTAPENRGQDYYHLTLNTPGLVSNRDLALDGNTIHGNLTVINTGLSRWQLVGGSSGTVTIMGDVIMASGQLATQGTSSATNVVVEHYGDVNVTGGNFSIGRGSQGSGTGTTIWNLHEGNFSMANATTQNSNPTPGNAKFVFTKDGGTQNLTLSNVTYGGGGLPIQVDSSTTLNMDTTAVGGNGVFILSEKATLATAHAGGIAGAVQSTGALTFNAGASYLFNGTVAQVTSTLMPDTVNGLAINNEAGVVLSQTTVINGVLRLMAGEFDNTIPFKLGPNSAISYEGGRLKVPVSVEERESELPKEFALFQNYPNPFNPSTTIRYHLPARARVTMKIYDVMGHEVAELMNGKPHEAGAFDFVWHAKGVTSGVYYLRISAGDFTTAQKLVLLK